MGNRLEVATAINTDGIYMDKVFSEEFYIDVWQSRTVDRLAHVFTALSVAIKALDKYYKELPAEPVWARLYPNPLPSEKVSIPDLEYLGQLSHSGDLLDTGTLFEEEYQKAVDAEQPYALYWAKMKHEAGELDVVVKFTVQYHARAHQILADNQLAPILHFHSSLVGGMQMVIMDYIDGS